MDIIISKCVALSKCWKDSLCIDILPKFCSGRIQMWLTRSSSFISGITQVYNPISSVFNEYPSFSFRVMYGRETMPPPRSISNFSLLWDIVLFGSIHSPTFGLVRPVLQIRSKNLPLSLVVRILIFLMLPKTVSVAKNCIAISR